MCCFVVCNLCYEGSLVAASCICLDVLCFLLMKYVLQCTFEKKKLARGAQPLRQPWASGYSLLPIMEHAREQLLELFKQCTPFIGSQIWQLHKTWAGRQHLIGAPTCRLILATIAIIIVSFSTHPILWKTIAAPSISTKAKPHGHTDNFEVDGVHLGTRLVHGLASSWLASFWLPPHCPRFPQVILKVGSWKFPQ